ncbi:MAG: hypothetical protein EPN77_19340 [Candidimonas sp.]|nr:MAG: hypothetical protein EPN77_19340 [Candidimonas sp.]
MKAMLQRPNIGVERVYIEAYACGEHADGPEWVEFWKPVDLLDTVVYLQRVVQGHRLLEARIPLLPVAWGPEGVSGDVDIGAEALVVTVDSFWLVAYPKHANDKFETRIQDIEAFRVALTESKAQRLILGCSPDELAKRIDHFAGCSGIQTVNSGGNDDL